MSRSRLQAPRGTFDVLPDDARRRAALAAAAEEMLEGAGYGRIETPVFEPTELFARGVGQSTDIVQKEMFSFEDQGGRSLTLRPEGTAPICRAYVEHGMHKLPQPVKLWYLGPFFRHEAPQAGRYRQFGQVGAEVLGSDEPSVDAEVILLLADLLERAGARALRLRLSSIGTPDARLAYSDELREHLRAREGQLSADVRARLDQNPLRAFDSDHPGTRAALAGAPRLIDRLGPEDVEHFAEVRALLDAERLDYEVDARLVRGLAYYTHTVVEFTSDALGAQSGVGGGGRYDGLVEQLGGPPTPGVGWAAGIERILLASERPAPPSAAPIYVALEDRSGLPAGFRLLRELRARGLSAQIEHTGRSLKAQLKHADRLRARAVVIVGDGGLQVRDMRSGEQRRAADAADAVALLLEPGAGQHP